MWALNGVPPIEFDLIDEEILLSVPHRLFYILYKEQRTTDAGILTTPKKNAQKIKAWCE
jgi:hypothetical protein